MDMRTLEYAFVRSLVALCAVVAVIALAVGILIGWWIA